MISRVEQKELAKKGVPLVFEPEEKIGVIVVDNFPLLGRLTALRFIEWVQQNPEGVIALPTGKTPEYFIKYCHHFLTLWQEPDTVQLLESYELDPANKPDFSRLRFVQIDEFYPMDPAQHNSFYYYIHQFYFKYLGIDAKRALLIDGSKIGMPKGYGLQSVWPEGSVDLSLRFRHAATNQERIQKDVLEAVDQYCFEYGETIHAMGGIGFFLGGIGPDGHVAFNVSGSDHHCTTRLAQINYETQAAAATDLGGIEVARKRHAITIGLDTITHNPDCTAIIMAAGEAKARVVADAVCQSPHIRYPATALHKLKAARFYLTEGAAKHLESRHLHQLKTGTSRSDEQIEHLVVKLAIQQQCAIEQLDGHAALGDVFIDSESEKVHQVLQQVAGLLIDKIERGSTVTLNKTFLHTAPHHDDIMLGYFPYAVRHMRDASNKHVFAYMTSGFTAVTNQYALSLVRNLLAFLKRPEFQKLVETDYFNISQSEHWAPDVWHYLDGVAADNVFMKQEGEARRVLRILMYLFEETDVKHLTNRIAELKSYFKTQYPGKKDPSHIQKFKGMIREWEAECLWGYMGFDHDSVAHLRLGFYQGDIFSEEPTVQRDVEPIVKLLHTVHPDVITVALDPEGSGPDTHYKVLQAVAEALRIYSKETGKQNIEVIGYRNVWYRFETHEANCFVPVSLNMFALMQSAFQNSFVSQKEASFPSYQYDGPFSGLAQKIQVEQYAMVKACLGNDYFEQHGSPLIRGTRGFVFLKKMSLDEFYHHARQLQEKIEMGGLG